MTPAVTSITPASVPAGSSDLTLTVEGSGFINTSVVEVNSVKETTTYVNSAKLTAVVPAAQLTAGGQLSIIVVNGSTSSGSNATLSLEVDNPVPTVASISPTSELVGTVSPVTTVTGTGFVSTTVVNVNGTARTTTYISPTQVRATLTAADVSAAGTLAVTAVNPAPGGGTSTAATISVTAATYTPTIYSVSPSTIYTGSPDTAIVVYGYGFTADSSVLWNGTPLVVTGYAGYYNYGSTLYATIPAADLATAGTASVTVRTPTDPALTSSAVTVTLSDPPAPTISSVYPASGPINTEAAITVNGANFSAASTITVNGESVPTTYVGSYQLTATIPASTLALPGNTSIAVTTPAPGGGTSSTLSYTAYVSIPNNDIAYSSKDGLLYVSVPTSGNGVSGNSVAALDPSTGNVVKQIWVGSNPTKLAISTDGTQLFVALSGAGAIAQVNLTTGTVARQFSLSNASFGTSATSGAYLAAVPGSPNSIAVSSSTYSGSSAVTIYDSGVARTNATGFYVYNGPIAFGADASTLYSAGNGIQALTVSSTGITGYTALSSSYYNLSSLRYDSGSLYLSNGTVLDTSTGALLGTFYNNSSAVSGAVVSDSALGKAFYALTGYSTTSSILAYDESTFNPSGSITVNGVANNYPYGLWNVARFGQNGIAANDGSEIFLFQSSVVQDLSSSPADLSVQLAAPSASTTGSTISYTATVKNLGSSSAGSATAALALDPSLIVHSITPSQGTCGSGNTFTCDFGTLANGSSATVAISLTPSTAGTIASSAQASSANLDSNSANNSATASTTVTGSFYGATPVLTALSPKLVKAGADDFTLTVTGTGFNESSTIYLGTTALATSFASSTSLTGAVSAEQVTSFGWAAVTVSNPTPGGGTSQALPLTIYQVLNVPANHILFDPYGQKFYASLPSSSTTLTGNSVVAIDPATAAVGTPVLIGSEPNVMAETDDGKYLYIGVSGANSLAQFDLTTQSLTATIPLSVAGYSGTTGVAATWLAPIPGSETSLAIGMNETWGRFGIYDISGATGAFRTNLSGIYEGYYPVFGDATHVYASYSGLYRYTVDANGLTYEDKTAVQGFNSYYAGTQFVGGRLYGSGGGIVNPSTTPPSQVAALTMPDLSSYSGTSSYGMAAAADPSTQKELLFVQNTSGGDPYALGRYDLNTYLLDDYVSLPGSALGTSMSSATIHRWGQDGVAVLSIAYTYSSSTATNAILLLRGPFVTPQLLQTNSAASLSSPSSITHGAGNTILTLNGSNLLPGVAVTWNGNYRTTTRVSATQVTINLPASDLATAGSASVVATNPGASASNTVTVTID